MTVLLVGVVYCSPAHRKPCRVYYKYTEKGERVRVSQRSGRIIPKPVELLERRDFKSRSGYAGKQSNRSHAYHMTIGSCRGQEGHSE